MLPGCTLTTVIPAHSEATLTDVQILADLADRSEEQYFPADVVFGDQPLPEEEVVFEAQTLQEVNIDLLVHGVRKPAPIKFKPLSFFCRKLAGIKLGVHVEKQKGMRNVGLKFTGMGNDCVDDFVMKEIGDDGNYFFRAISYCCGQA